jgi:lambda family phage minor tail protein L
VTLTADIQQLEPGGWIELFELDATVLGADHLFFHRYLQIGVIWWQGVQYSPWPIDTQGFELNPNQPPTPTLSAGNVDGRMTALCLAYQDLVGAKLVRHRTLVRYLDAANFPAGNPTADATQEVPLDVWFIERRSAENNTSVTWELSSALDFNGRQSPGRQIIANSCGWLSRGGYRGPNCGYTGPAVAKSDDSPTTDPALDRCGGRLSSCRLRFGQNGELPYGSFPAASLIK